MVQLAQRTNYSLGFVGEKSVRDQEQIISACENICADLIMSIKTDVLTVETVQITKTNDLAHVSTIGVICSGVVVENTLLGGPAWDSGLIITGDKILAVDGAPATGQNVTTLLVGEDVPGSIVQIDIQRGGVHETVKLTRMNASKIADRRKMFEYFADIKNKIGNLATKGGGGGGGLFNIGGKTDVSGADGKNLMETVDIAIELWNGICRAEADHNQVVVENVLKMQMASVTRSNAMFDKLKELHAVYNRDVELFASEQKKHEEQLAALRMELEARKVANHQLTEAKMDVEVHAHELEDSIQEMQNERLKMRTQIAELKRQVADEEHKRQDADHEVEALQTQIAALKLQAAARQEHITALEAKIKAMVAAANKLQKSLVDEEHAKHDVEHQRDNLKAQLKKMEAVMVDLNRTIAAKDMEIADMTKTLENEQHLLHDMEHDRDAYKRELDKADADIFELGTKMDYLKKTVEHLQSEITRLAGLDATCTAQENRIAHLTSLLTALRFQMAQLHSAGGANEAALQSLRDERDKLWKANELLTAEIKRLSDINGTLSANIKAKDREIHLATSNLIAEQKKTTIVESEKAALQSEKDQLIREIKRLEGEVARGKANAESLNQTIEGLKQRLLDLESRVTELEKEKNDSVRLARSLESQLASCNAQCAKKDAELEELRRKLEASIADLEVMRIKLANAEQERDAARLEASKLQAALNRANDEIAKLEGSIAFMKLSSSQHTDADVGYRLLTAKLRKRIKELEDELARLKTATPIAGVGLLLDKRYYQGDTTGVVVINGIVPGGAAFDSHKIFQDDILRSVNGNVIGSLKMDDIFALIQGGEGTPIALEIERPHSKELFYVQLRRKVITRVTDQQSAGFTTGPPGGMLSSSINAGQANVGAARGRTPANGTPRNVPASPRRDGGSLNFW